LGANARYWLGTWIAEKWGGSFPLGTLLINLTGSLLLGFFMTVATERFLIDPRWGCSLRSVSWEPTPPSRPTPSRASICSSSASGRIERIQGGSPLIETDGLYILLKDHLGSTTEIIAENDSVTRIRYTAWGETLSASGAIPTDKQYTGQTKSSNSGLYFYQARRYDPYHNP
jgi:hypothetical protein